MHVCTVHINEYIQTGMHQILTNLEIITSQQQINLICEGPRTLELYTNEMSKRQTSAPSTLIVFGHCTKPSFN